MGLIHELDSPGMIDVNKTSALDYQGLNLAQEPKGSLKVTVTLPSQAKFQADLVICQD